MRKARKVAIVARSPSSRFLAPFRDEAWEIWTLSPMGAPSWTDIPRWDRWYEIHHLEEKELECPGYIEFLARAGDRVYLREPHRLLPDAKVYPRDQIVEYFAAQFERMKFRYFTNSVSLMMAHAIMQNVDELGVWGCDMAQTAEYQAQKPSCEFFLGWAAGSGIRVHLPEECDLLKCRRLYGLEDPTHTERKIAVREAELEARLKEKGADYQESKAQAVGAAAAHGELTKLLEGLNGEAPAEFVQAAGDRLRQLEQISQGQQRISADIDKECQMLSGALEEVRYQRQFT